MEDNGIQIDAVAADGGAEAGDKPIILHVDDDPLMRAMVRRHLSRIECDCWEAEDGVKALELAKRQPDLIVLDVDIPGMNGLEICRRLKEDPETRIIPVLHLTGAYAADDDLVAGLESGADGYLTKPVPTSVLLATVRALLRIRKAEKSLERAAREARLLAVQAQAESRAKGQFLAAVSHELRTPLNAVLGMSGALLDSELTAEQSDQAGTVRLNAQRLLRLIENVLEYTRLDVKQQETRTGRFNVAEKIRQSLRPFQGEADERGVALFLDVGDGLDVSARGDGDGFGRVVTNLVDNAIKFTGTGGAVAVRAQCEGLEDGRLGVTVDVEDSGAGMSPERQRRVFEAFGDVESVGTRSEDGLGLGLCVSRQLVALMGGALQVTSPVDRSSSMVGEAGGPSVWGDGSGGGTRCSFDASFEMLSGRPEAKRAPARKTEFGTVRALVVDDKMVNRKVAASILKRLGCGYVLACESGKQALKAMCAEDFDVVLLDIQMPEMDGFEVARRIRDRAYGVRRSDVPVIAVTANVQPECRDACTEAGMDDYLPKPITVPQVSTMLRRHVFGAAEEKVPDAGVPVTVRGVFDKSGAVERLGGNEEDFWDLVPVFMEELPGEIDRLREAVVAKDLEQVQFIAHSVKGAGGSLGAVLMTSTAEKLERKSGEWDWNRVEAAFARLDREFSAFRDVLESERPGL